MRSVFFLLCVPFFLFALEFKVATYNVENLFDAKQQGSEYKEYTPNNKHGWNEAMLNVKINNLAQVIKAIDADVIALAEVENRAVLEALNAALGEKRYKYLFFPQKKPRVSIETALLSRFEIRHAQSIFLKDQPRGIHRITLNIVSYELDVYINHWPAQREKEEERKVYAKALHEILEKNAKRESIVLGDFNSPLEPQKEGWGDSFSQLSSKEDSFLQNLWYELPQKRRYSHSYGTKRTALDHILVAPTLSDGEKIEYKQGTFSSFITPFLIDEKGIPKRWQISDRGRGRHLGEGYSDHLALTAIFHTVSH